MGGSLHHKSGVTKPRVAARFNAVLCLLLAVLLATCMSPIAPSALAAGDNASNPALSAGGAHELYAANAETSFNVRFPSSTNTKSDLQVVLNYSDDLFAAKSNVYNDKLGYASVCLAAAAGNSSEETEYENKAKNVQEFLKNVGCVQGDIQVNADFVAKPTEQSIGVAVGHKDITVTEGGAAKTYKLFVVGVRGISYESEWASNFKVGTSGDHQGFAESRDKVLAFVLPYIAQHTSANDNVKVWIAGYSRGGAVANLVGGWIDTQLKDGTALPASTIGTTAYDLSNRVLSTGDVYCYTASAPQGAAQTSVDANNQHCVGIHNLINPDDWIPQVGMSWWGFGRYGTDHDLSSTNRAGAINRDTPMLPDKSEAVSAMMARLNKINSGAAYTAPWFKQYYFSLWNAGAEEDKGGDGNAYISKKTELTSRQGRYFEEFGRFLCDALGANDRDAFVAEYQEGFSYLAWLFMGLPADKTAKLGTAFKAHMTDALRKQLNRPNLSLDNLGTDALYILNLVLNNLPGLTTVCKSTLQDTLEELGVAYDQTRLDNAAATMAKMLQQIVKKDNGYFYHLMTVVKSTDSIAQAHYPEAALAWWEGSDADPVPPKQDNPVTLRFYDNKDGEYTASDDQLVFAQTVYEGDTLFFSNGEQPTIDGKAVDDGVTYYKAPTQEHYTFIGWETKPVAGEEGHSEYYHPEDNVYYGDFEPSDVQSGVCNLYAVWDGEIKGNGGPSDPGSSADVAESQTAKESVAAKAAPENTAKTGDAISVVAVAAIAVVAIVAIALVLIARRKRGQT